MAFIRKSGDPVEEVPVWEAQSNRRAAKSFGLNVHKAAIRAVSKFGHYGIEGDGLPSGRRAHEGAGSDVLGDALHKERLDAVPGTGPHAVANFPDRRMK
jgi:hypothetical protein